MAPRSLNRWARPGGMASAPEPQTRTEREVAVVGAGLLQHPVHRRHADEEAGPPLLDGVEDAHRVEVRQQVDRDAGHGQPDQDRRTP